MFRFFNVCDHSVNFKDRKLSEQRITLEGKEDLKIRRITKGAIVLGIKGVIVHEQYPFKKIDPIEYDALEDYDTTTGTRGYYDENSEELVDFEEYIASGEYIPPEYYEKYLHNRIKWLVRPPKKYTVVVDLIVQGDFYTKVNINDCERCQGNGWYVDITDNNQRFEATKGTFKILQNVIKDLVTKISSSRLDSEYGQRLHLLPREHYDEERLFEDIQLEVAEVEENYILRQQPILNDLPRDEILVNLEVAKIKMIEGTKTRVLLMLRIITEEEDRMFQFRI